MTTVTAGLTRLTTAPVSARVPRRVGGLFLLHHHPWLVVVLLVVLVVAVLYLQRR